MGMDLRRAPCGHLSPPPPPPLPSVPRESGYSMQGQFYTNLKKPQPYFDFSKINWDLIELDHD